ncbi:hypothetical protein ACQUSR_27575 [Streptomyces sp. P1-3]|uniref:hypothetical protein n=1 Tax=Streptomyces sp. P1-3 TaxID=3421658 RepID=UPI003D36FB89
MQQFTALFGRMHVTPLDVAGAQVTYETGGVDGAGDAALDQPADASLTEDFRRGVAALQDLLVRDEPGTAEAFTGWTWLAGLEVRLLPGLRIRLDPGDTYELIELPVDAQIDRGRNTLFLHSHTALTTKAGAGAAIAAHFAEERSRVGHSWRVVGEEHLVETGAGTASHRQGSGTARNGSGLPKNCAGVLSGLPPRRYRTGSRPLSGARAPARLSPLTRPASSRRPALVQLPLPRPSPEAPDLAPSPARSTRRSCAPW